MHSFGNKIWLKKQNGEFVILNVLSNISNIIIPVIIFYIVAYGLISKRNVYEDFIKGAKDGFHTVIQIMPTLVGLMVAVGVLRASDFWHLSEGYLRGDGSDWFSVRTRTVAFYQDVFIIGRNGSGTGYIQNTWSGFLYRHDYFDYDELYGNDILYDECLLSGVKVTKTRYTLSGALISMLVGVAASVVLAGMF